MNDSREPKIGFTCAYTPPALIEAAGFVPFRILPMGDPPDQAGRFLHDNLCPHVKTVLDIAISGKLPELGGVVFVNSCDAMRRLADGWQAVRPDDRCLHVDLPATVDDSAKRFFATELKHMVKHLGGWSHRSISEADLAAAVARYNTLCGLLVKLNRKMCEGRLKGASVRMQEMYNLASRQSAADSIAILSRIDDEPEATDATNDGIPVFLFGNVLPDPQAFELFESCGVRVVGDDFCTGARMFSPIEGDLADDAYFQIAAALLARPPCARTFSVEHPGKIASDVIARAQACGARGIIGHTLKFCDPYLARVPVLREKLKEASFPFLFLEGDCTLRSIGQQRTRIEAFMEMLR